MINRREFLKISLASGGAAYLSTRARFLLNAHAQQIPLSTSAIPKFIEPLPLLSVAGGRMETILAGSGEITLTMKEFKVDMLSIGTLPNGNTYEGTWVWGYRGGNLNPGFYDTYIGPVIVAYRGTPTQVKFVNNLTANHIYWRDWTDQTLHWADPLHDGANACMMGIMPSEPPSEDCAAHYGGSIPAVPHLHGGEQPPEIDGGPEQWFTADGSHVGNAYYSKDNLNPKNYCVYRYLNVQEAAPLWFHDHLLGGTRLNVYAGLAGAYALTDPGLTLPTGLHPVGMQQGESGPVDYLIPLVIQDRMFDTDGQLLFPNLGINPEHPYWVPEFVGDTIVVNGKAWPFLSVEPRRYRFLLINGSNARTYELFLVNPNTKAMGPPIWQIETDGGYLDKPVKIDPNLKPLDKLRVMPGERAGFIIDFAGYEDQILLVRNTGRTPYPKGETPHGNTLGRIMLFRVGSTSLYNPDESYDPATSTEPLRPEGREIIRLVDSEAGTLAEGVSYDVRRQLTLNEVENPEPITTEEGDSYPGGPLEVLVNNTKWAGTDRDDFTQLGPNFLSELPNEGNTELWEIVNLTADSHPIHTHLTQFQLMNRQKFNMNKYGKIYESTFPDGEFMPAYGPPLAYDNNPDILGGNPDVTQYLQGPVRLPDANEAGWKDTVMVPPGMVTRFVVRFTPFDTPIDGSELYAFEPYSNTSPYVWHCHIIDHEDNEMMRPYAVISSGAGRTYTKGTDY
jgi:spore coat protein A